MGARRTVRPLPRRAGNSPRGRAVFLSDLQGFVDGQLARVDMDFDFFANGRLPGELVQGPIACRLTLTPGLRWEYFGIPYSTGHEAARQVNFYLGEGATYYERFANGSFFRTTDAPGKYRNHFMLRDRNNFGPRMGLAYDLSGEGKTVVRAGWGIFFNRGYGVGIQTLSGTISFPNVPFTPAMLENPYAIPGQATNAAPTITHLDPDLRDAYTSAWNATVEHEWGGTVVFAASYVGSSSSGFPLLVTENGLGSGRYVGRPAQRLLPNYSYFLTVKNLAHSTYHALQLKADSRQIRRLGLQFGANYTWSHSIDNASATDREAGGFSDGIVFGRDNLRLDSGNSSFDQMHRFVTHFIWQIPAVRSGSNVVNHLATGWQASGILSFQTGQPFHLYGLGTPDRDFVFSRPRLTGDCTTNAGRGRNGRRPVGLQPVPVSSGQPDSQRSELHRQCNALRLPRFYL